MDTLIRRRVLRRLIWVCTACLFTTKTLDLCGLIQNIKNVPVEIQLQKIEMMLIRRYAFTERVADRLATCWTQPSAVRFANGGGRALTRLFYLLFPSSFIIDGYMIKMVNLFVGFTNFFQSLIYVNHYERGQPICGRNGLFIGRRLVILKIYMRMYFIYFLEFFKNVLHKSCIENNENVSIWV